MKLDVYCSHSWHPEQVELNLAVWEQLHHDCLLYIDKGTRPSSGYHINRLEALIRGCDAFLSILNYRQQEAAQSEAMPDYALHCSEWALFELRLAERARKPRWVIYDDRTRLQPMDTGNDLMKYTAIDEGEVINRVTRSLQIDAARWLRELRESLPLTEIKRLSKAAILLGRGRNKDSQLIDTIRSAVEKSGFTNIEVIEDGYTDTDAIRCLQSVGLLVAEVDGEGIDDIYGMAHAMFVPTIRFVETRDADLPRLLSGHPGGYQHDLVVGSPSTGLGDEITRRASDMRFRLDPLDGRESGRRYFLSRRYRPHYVFVSHNVDYDDADFIKCAVKTLFGLGVEMFEYRSQNKAGDEWHPQLDKALEEATDAVFIFSNNFENSPICLHELDVLLQKKQDNKLDSVIPFFWGGRHEENYKLKDIHHTELPTSTSEAVDVLVSAITSRLAK
jgi:hypothetical protein